MTEQTAQPRQFKKVAHVTLPLLKIKPGVAYYVRCTGPMHLGKEIAAKAEVNPETGEIVTKKKDPAFIMFVDDISTDAENPVQIICSTVFRKEMEAAYPNGSYVGKCFEFSIQRPAGKDYNVPQIAEVEDPNPAKGDEARAKFLATKTASAPATDSATTDDAPKAPAKKK